MDRLSELEARVGEVGSAIVAFSGGVDSSLVAAVAARALGERSLAVTAVSPALASGELDGARSVARAIGAAHQTISTDELARAAYRANGRDRCYHCKTELYTSLSALAEARGFSTVLSGANADDVGDWRPGLRAATEHGVRHPLLELGMGKAEVRDLARSLRIPSADKPASPCLASRIPYGTTVEPSVLARIDRAELALRELGYRVLRVRHFGETARVELGIDELDRIRDANARAVLERAIIAAGYTTVEIGAEPFRSGTLNRLGRPLPLVAI
jgi:uncharacterized protein